MRSFSGNAEAEGSSVTVTPRARSRSKSFFHVSCQSLSGVASSTWSRPRKAELIKDKAEAVGRSGYGFAAQVRRFESEHLGKARELILASFCFLLQPKDASWRQRLPVPRILSTRHASGAGVWPYSSCRHGRRRHRRGHASALFQGHAVSAGLPTRQCVCCHARQRRAGQFFMKQGKEAHRAAYLHSVNSREAAAEIRNGIRPCAAVHIFAEYDFHRCSDAPPRLGKTGVMIAQSPELCHRKEG